IAATKCAWNFGSMAVSIFSTRRTSCSMVLRESLSRRARRAPLPAALPAEDHRVLDVDVAAESAGETDAVDVIHPHVLHEQRDPGAQRRLGELDGAHVVLGDLQRR